MRSVAQLAAIAAALVVTPVFAVASDTGTVADAPLADINQRAWQEQMDAGEFKSATETANRWLLKAQREYGADSLATFEPIVARAQAMAAADDVPGSVIAYEQAMAVAAQHFDAYDLRMVAPLAEMGRLFLANGRPERGIEMLSRARGITQRQLGLFNLRQEKIVEDLARGLAREGDIVQASREHNILLAAAEKAFGDSPDLVPALHRWASWQKRIGNVYEARRVLQRAIRIVERDFGANDPRLEPTLTRYARTFQEPNGRVPYPAEGARALRRIVDIYRGQQYIDVISLLQAEVRLADWYAFANSRMTARKGWKTAIDNARKQGLSSEEIDRMFAWPQEISNDRRPIATFGGDPVKLRERHGEVLTEFRVTEDGIVRSIDILDDTVGLVTVRRAIRERLAETRFRPRFVNGEPVATVGVRKRFEIGTPPLRLPSDPPPETLADREADALPAQDNELETGRPSELEAGDEPER